MTVVSQWLLFYGGLDVDLQVHVDQGHREILPQYSQVNTHRDLREAEYSAFLLVLRRIGPNIIEPEIACCLEFGAMTLNKSHDYSLWVLGGRFVFTI